MSKVIILRYREINQSQSENNQTGRNPITRKTHDFSPKVYVLAGTLVPIVSINTWWFGG
jgi:hypothetical protein